MGDGKKWLNVLLGLATFYFTANAGELALTSEPIYEGKPLSFWFEKYEPPSSVEWAKKADGAMAHAGTNAIAVLLRLLRSEDDGLNLRASHGFGKLGERASNAVPALVETVRQRISWASQKYTMWSLASIGPAAQQAIPLLLENVRSPYSYVRIEAIAALRDIHSEPKKVVPVLIESLRDREYGVRSWAASALAAYGQDAKPAIPMMLNLLKHTDTNAPNYLSHAIMAIDPEAGAKAGLN